MSVLGQERRGSESVHSQRRLQRNQRKQSRLFLLLSFYRQEKEATTTQQESASAILFANSQVPESGTFLQVSESQEETQETQSLDPFGMSITSPPPSTHQMKMRSPYPFETSFLKRKTSTVKLLNHKNSLKLLLHKELPFHDPLPRICPRKESRLSMVQQQQPITQRPEDH